MEHRFEPKQYHRTFGSHEPVLRVQPGGDPLNFLGYAIQWHRDLKGGKHFYVAVYPSEKAMSRFRARVRALTAPKRGLLPLFRIASDLNAYMRGWKVYFGHFQRHRAFSSAGASLRNRMSNHLQRRSQRPYRLRGGMTWYQVIHDHLGIMRP